MLKNQLLLSCFCALTINLAAQAPAIQWQRTLGGSNREDLVSIQQTADGGYFLGGWTLSGISGNKSVASKGATDYWILKLDGAGNTLWEKSIGGTSDDRLEAAVLTSDGGFALGGTSFSGVSADKTVASNGDADFWIVKTDSSGNIQWQKSLGGSSFEQLGCLQQTADGGYILGGLTTSDASGNITEDGLGGWDCWVVKLDAVGNIQWQNTLGGSGHEQVNSVQQTSDGGYILGGSSDSDISFDKTENSQGLKDFWIVKLNASGNIEWQNTIGGNKLDYVTDVKQTMEGTYIIGGYSYSSVSGDKAENSLGGSDYWLVKLDASGNIQRQNTLGGNMDDFATHVEPTLDGGYIFTGWSQSGVSGDKSENSLGYEDCWVVKLNSNLSVVWQNTIGGAYEDWSLTGQITRDGGFVLGGISQSDISGDKTEDCLGLYDYWVVKLNPESPLKTAETASTANLRFSPNPFQDALNITLKESPGSDLSIRFFDLTGQWTSSYAWPNGSTSLDIPTGNWRPGLYFAQVRNAAGAVIYAEKLVKGE